MIPIEVNTKQPQIIPTKMRGMEDAVASFPKITKMTVVIKCPHPFENDFEPVR